MLVVLPGSVGPRRRLVDVLREQHNDRVEAWKLDVAFREKHGIPSTPDIDWAEERRRAAAITVAVEREDPALVRLGATAALTAMSPAPQDPGEFVEPEGLGDVVIAPRFVSARKMRELRTAWAQALSAGDREATEQAENRIIDCCIATIDGLQYTAAPVGDDVGNPSNAHELEAWRAAGLTPWLLVAALYLQGLPSGKAWRSGVRLPTT
jgi:hypothetical protein